MFADRAVFVSTPHPPAPSPTRGEGVTLCAELVVSVSLCNSSRELP